MVRWMSAAACVALVLVVGNLARAADDEKELKELVAQAIKAHGAPRILPRSRRWSAK